LFANGQSIERKIVIQNNNLYYTTIDDKNQLATMYSGFTNQPLKTARPLALPAGRNYNDPIIPFAWDVSNKYFFAINFLNHPLNDRNEAIKRFAISSLVPLSDAVTVQDMLMQSVDKNTFCLNDPYQFTIKRSNILNNFFFDGIALNDSTFFMAITNNGEISFWEYSGGGWEHSEVQKLPVEGYFTLVTKGSSIYMVLSTGKVYKVSTKAMTLVNDKDLKTNLNTGMMIVNKDNRTVSFLKTTDFNNNKSLNELIKTKALQVF
jgi:hypothetical protein